MKILIVVLTLIASNAWSASEGSIYAQFVTASTGVAVGSPIEIHTGSVSETQSSPAVAFYNDRFLVVWNEWNTTYDDLDIRGARIETDGTVLDTTPLDIHVADRNQSMPDVAADSSGWMVVWESFESINVVPSIRVERVDYDGTLNHSGYQTFGTTPSYSGWTKVGSYPKIAWDGTNHFVVYSGMKGNFAAETDGAVVTTTPSYTLKGFGGDVNGQSETHYSIASIPSVGGWSILTADGTHNPWAGSEVVSSIATAYTPTGDEGSAAALDSTSTWAAGSKVVWQGGDITTDSAYNIAVWTRWTYGGYKGSIYYDGDLYAGRIEDGDTRIDALGGVEVSATSDVAERYPSIAGDGAGNLLVAYEKDTAGSTEIASRILTVDGSGITPSSEVILRTDTTGSRRSQTDVAYGDGVFLVVWTEGWEGKL